MDIKILVGKRVKELRNKLGISQEELAARAAGLLNLQRNKKYARKSSFKPRKNYKIRNRNIRIAIYSTVLLTEPLRSV